MLMGSFLSDFGSRVFPAQDAATRTATAHALTVIDLNIRISYDVLSTTTWFLSLVRQRNCTASGSRRSRPSRMILMQNGAQEAKARRCLPRRSEPLPPSTGLRPLTRRRPAQREPDAWIPGGGVPS